MNSFNYEEQPPIGIDLGTSNCAIARYAKSRQRRGAIAYTLNQMGHGELMPSAVFLEEVDGQETLVVGKGASSRRMLHPERFAWAIKRKMADAGTRIPLGARNFGPVELSAEILAGLFIDPVSQGLTKPSGVVVTVPYHFKQPEHQNTLLAIENALQKVFPGQEPNPVWLLPEPIAAAIDHVVQQNSIGFNKTVLVFDLGGGTLDITAVRIDHSGTSLQFEVLSSAGASNFGGEVFDEVLEAHVRKEAGISEEGLNERMAAHQRHQLRQGVTDAKELLSSQQQTTLMAALPCGIGLDLQITRSELEGLLCGNNEINRDFDAETRSYLQEALSVAKLKPQAIDTVLLVGGASQMPFFLNLLSRHFPSARLLSDTENAKSTVARGAAVFAAHMLDKEKGHHHGSFGVELEAVQMVSRTRHGLGLAIAKGRTSVLIPPNSIVPANASKTYYATRFSPEKNNQLDLDELHLYQGSSGFTTDNEYIGTIAVPPIFTQGRPLHQVPITIQFLATDTLVEIQVNVPEGRENGSDLHFTAELKHTNT